jgi:hypothetical protein
LCFEKVKSKGAPPVSGLPALNRHRQASTWKRFLTIPALTAVLATTFGGAAQATGASLVVPPGGTVAGHGYAYWLGASNRNFFDTGGSPEPCQTLHAGGQPVAFLDGANTSSDIPCSVPAGRPIYVHGVSNECSTFQGDHNGFGTSPAQLQRCARQGFEHLSGAASIDGVNVTNYRELITAARLVDVLVPAHNAFGLKGGPGRSAAYGEGLLLRGFSAGKHTIRVNSNTPGGQQTRTFIVEVS